MQLTDKLTITNEDCMDLLKRTPDKFYGLCIIDPPYGIGYDGSKNHTRGSKKAKAKVKDYKGFTGSDKHPMPKAFFTELKRVSVNQIIWGANHFIENIPDANSSAWIVWDKVNGDCDFADCELAYTSFLSAVRQFTYTWNGFQQGPTKQSIEKRIHPTQKPVALYKWLLDRYAKQGDKILDTHLGSGSIAIACHDYGFDLTACELDKHYYDLAIKRIQGHIAQTKLFI